MYSTTSTCHTGALSGCTGAGGAWAGSALAAIGPIGWVILGADSKKDRYSIIGNYKLCIATSIFYGLLSTISKIQGVVTNK